MSVSIPGDKWLPALLEGLASWSRRVVEEAISVATGQGRPLYVVGGVVRDFLLGRPGLDVDLLVEAPPGGVGPGDDPLLRELAFRLEALLHPHPRFGTATLHLPGGGAVDVVRARTEIYDKPAALPRVEMGTISQDLARRDFTIGAMALRLTPGDSSPLLDLHGGREDLEEGRVRVLHAHSFEDDPTRLFRAVRLAARLGFELEPATRMWMELAFSRDYPDLLSPRRISAELRKMAGEDSFPGALALLEELGGLASLHLGPGVVYLSGLFGSYLLWRRGQFPVAHLPGVEDPFLVVVLALLEGLPEGQRRRALARWELGGGQGRQLLRDLEICREIMGLLRFGAPRSQAVWVADELSPPGWVFLALKVYGSELWGPFLHLLECRLMKSPLNGRDLVALGVQPGPRMAELQKGLRAALINGEITSREDAEVMVRSTLEARL